MMLLPSGRSNNVPVNNTINSQFLTRLSSPQLAIYSSNKTENGSYAQTAPMSTSTSSPTSVTNTMARELPVSEQFAINSSSSATDSTISTPPANHHHQLYTTQMHSNTATTSGNVLPSNSPGSQSETGTTAAGRTNSSKVTFLANANISTSAGALAAMTAQCSGNWEDIDRHLEAIQIKLKNGWSVHLGKEGRLYYCNHITQTSGWLPSCEDWSKQEELPYGWERAIDSKGRSYFINHLNKTSTYEAPECIKWDENPPEPRVVVLQRSSTMGFGFVAGSERPVIVRFVTEDGPSMNKLLPGDQILAVNGEDVKDAPRDRVIQLVRACETQVTLLVCQPAHNITPGRKSTLLSAGKKAKLKTRPNRVRFAESVCVNGAPLFPPSAFSLGDICVPPMANVLKVFLENGQTKSFKYDATTTVQDVVTSLLDKLCFTSGEIFSLVLEHVKSLKRNKLTLLDPEESLAKIASRPGAHKLRCLFRVTFVPISAADLAQKDLNALDYLYMQCCNDVTQERFAPELQPDVALRLAALHMHQHALANNVTASKLTVKVVEREFGLERFVPISLFEGMKRKELRRLISHFLKINAEMTGSSTKVLTQLQAKLHYLDIIASLPSYGAKCFSTNQREGVERVLLVSPRFGLSQISSARNSVPQPISAIEDFGHIIVQREDDITCSVSIFMQGDRVVKFFMEDRDACEFSLCLAGYYRLLTGKILPVSREREPVDEDNAPSYLSQHMVLPAFWSYLLPFHSRAHSINFLMTPPYHPCKTKIQKSEQDQAECMTEKTETISECTHLPSNLPLLSSTAMDLDIHSVMATELLEEAKDSGLSDSSGGGSNYGDRSQNCSNTAKMEAKNEEVLKRVQEMQKMVENSEQYLNEQGEHIQEFRLTNTNSVYTSAVVSWQSPTNILHSSSINSCGVVEFDSDCDSLNSSKLSSNEETPQQGSLKHSDSLVLLAETINHDLSGIAQGLNSIGENSTENRRKKPTLIDTSSPRPERKVNGFSQLLSNLQALGTDFSQSESDSESIASPTNSPTTRRPSLLNTNDKSSRKQNLAYRSSFGLHSPDSSNFGMETKDYNLKEYLKQLKEISNVDHLNQDTDVAAKKLSKIYGFEIREDTFIETDTDLIDLRAIPPPQTPDELDALSLLNAAPKGFDDLTKKTLNEMGHEQDLDKFLEKVVVAPPTQKATPAKELTPEEIMSFIIPPPPNLDEIDTKVHTEEVYTVPECLYSNSLTERKGDIEPASRVMPNEDLRHVETKGHIIEYATVERKSKFSCCPKSKKEDTTELSEEVTESVKPPPRSKSVDQAAPVRPPKSAELMQRFSSKKQNLNMSSLSQWNGVQSEVSEGNPPVLPPKISRNTSPHTIAQEERTNMSSMVSPSVPKKPPLPPIAARPMLRKIPSPLNYTEAIDTSTAPLLPPPTKPRVFPSPNNSTVHSPTLTPLSQSSPTLSTQQQIIHHSATNNRDIREQRYPPPPYPLLTSPQIQRKIQNTSPINQHNSNLSSARGFNNTGSKLIIKNGHVIDPEALLAKTDVAMAGLLVKLDQVAAQCTAAQSAGGGSSIDEDKFQKARNELTEQTLVLVTASKYLVVTMSDMSLSTLPEHLTSCLTAIRRITELTQDMTRHTSSPLQTRNIVLKVHDVASSFRELVSVQMGPLGAGQLALQAECLANVLATLLRSLRVFSP